MELCRRKITDLDYYRERPAMAPGVFRPWYYLFKRPLTGLILEMRKRRINGKCGCLLETMDFNRPVTQSCLINYVSCFI